MDKDKDKDKDKAEDADKDVAPKGDGEKRDGGKEIAIDQIAASPKIGAVEDGVVEPQPSSDPLIDQLKAGQATADQLDAGPGNAVSDQSASHTPDVLKTDLEQSSPGIAQSEPVTYKDGPGGDQLVDPDAGSITTGDLADGGSGSGGAPGGDLKSTDIESTVLTGGNTSDPVMTEYYKDGSVVSSTDSEGIIAANNRAAADGRPIADETDWSETNETGLTDEKSGRESAPYEVGHPDAAGGFGDGDVSPGVVMAVGGAVGEESTQRTESVAEERETNTAADEAIFGQHSTSDFFPSELDLEYGEATEQGAKPVDKTELRDASTDHPVMVEYHPDGTTTEHDSAKGIIEANDRAHAEGRPITDAETGEESPAVDRGGVVLEREVTSSPKLTAVVLKSEHGLTDAEAVELQPEEISEAEANAAADEVLFDQPKTDNESDTSEFFVDEDNLDASSEDSEITEAEADAAADEVLFTADDVDDDSFFVDEDAELFVDESNLDASTEDNEREITEAEADAAADEVLGTGDGGDAAEPDEDDGDSNEDTNSDDDSAEGANSDEEAVGSDDDGDSDQDADGTQDGQAKETDQENYRSPEQERADQQAEAIRKKAGVEAEPLPGSRVDHSGDNVDPVEYNAIDGTGSNGGRVHGVDNPEGVDPLGGGREAPIDGAIDWGPDHDDADSGSAGPGVTGGDLAGSDGLAPIDASNDLLASPDGVNVTDAEFDLHEDHNVAGGIEDDDDAVGFEDSGGLADFGE